MEDRMAALKLGNQLCFPLYAASRAVIRQYHDSLAELGLTYTQYIALMVLWEEDEVHIKELSRKLFLDTGTLTPLLKSMEQKGLITRNRDRNDERSVLVCLTEKGRALQEKAVGIPEKIGRCVKINPEEAVELYRLLYKILDGLEN